MTVIEAHAVDGTFCKVIIQGSNASIVRGVAHGSRRYIISCLPPAPAQAAAAALNTQPNNYVPYFQDGFRPFFVVSLFLLLLLPYSHGVCRA